MTLYSRRLFFVFLFVVAFHLSYAQENLATPNDIASSVSFIANRDVGGNSWHIESTFRSTLHIQNILKTPKSTLLPVIGMTGETEYDSTPISLEKAASIGINMAPAIADVPTSCSYSKRRNFST